MKFLIYQIIVIAIIWIGMLFFFNEMHETGKMIFYALTSWLLFLLVLLVKDLIKSREK